MNVNKPFTAQQHHVKFMFSCYIMISIPTKSSVKHLQQHPSVVFNLCSFLLLFVFRMSLGSRGIDCTIQLGHLYSLLVAVVLVQSPWGMVVWCFPAASLIKLSIHVKPSSGQCINRCQSGVHAVHGGAPEGSSLGPQWNKYHWYCTQSIHSKCSEDCCDRRWCEIDITPYSLLIKYVCVRKPHLHSLQILSCWKFISTRPKCLMMVARWRL